MNKTFKATGLALSIVIMSSYVSEAHARNQAGPTYNEIIQDQEERARQNGDPYQLEKDRLLGRNSGVIRDSGNNGSTFFNNLFGNNNSGSSSGSSSGSGNYTYSGSNSGTNISSVGSGSAKTVIENGCMQATKDRATDAIIGKRATAVHTIKKPSSFDKLSCLQRLMSAGLGFMFSPSSIGDVVNQLINMACNYAEDEFNKAVEPLEQSVYSGFDGAKVGGMNIGKIGGGIRTSVSTGSTGSSGLQNSSGNTVKYNLVSPYAGRNLSQDAQSWIESLRSN